MQITSMSLTAPNMVKVPTPSDQLEQAFLEEMLKYCGPRAGEGSFAGGHGEEQFTSFLTQEYAGILAGRLDLGLASQFDGAQS